MTTLTSEYGDASIRRTSTSEETTITIVLSGSEAKQDSLIVNDAVVLQLNRLGYMED